MFFINYKACALSLTESVILKKLSIVGTVYFIHSIMPIFHSRIVLVKKIIMIIIIFQFREKVDISLKGIGMINPISTSKIKNRMEIEKNWLEIIFLLLLDELKPHSNVDDLSFLLEIFFSIKKHTEVKINEIVVEMIIMLNRFIR